jgi:hypothetical protein
MCASKGWMAAPPLRLGGARGGTDALGTIRSMLEQYRAVAVAVAVGVGRHTLPTRFPEAPTADNLQRPLPWRPSLSLRAEPIALSLS